MNDTCVANPGHLEHPSRRLAIIRALAAGAIPAELARKYDVSDQAISLFRRRHADAIDRQRDKLDDDFAALWVADKANRIGLYQQQIEYVLDMLEPDETGDGTARKAGVNVSTAELLRTAQTAAKAIADELGQIPARVQVSHSGSVAVQLNGVDVRDLT